MSGDSENPDDLIFDDENLQPDSGDEGTGDKKDKIEGEVVFGDESDRQQGLGSGPAPADEADAPDDEIYPVEGPGYLDQQHDEHAPGDEYFLTEELAEEHAEVVHPTDLSGEEGSLDSDLPEGELDDPDLRTGDIAAALSGEPGVPQRRAADHEGEDRILFGDQSVEDPSHAFDLGKEPFSEDTGAGWEGHFLPADQIGIPTTDSDDEDVGFRETDPLASDLDQDFDLVMEEEELQLVDDESELDAAADAADSWVAEGAVVEGTVADAGTEEGWVFEAEGEDQDDQEFVLADAEHADQDTIYAEDDNLYQEEGPGFLDQPGQQDPVADENTEFVLDEGDLVLGSDEAEVDPEWAPVASGGTLDDDDAFVLQDEEDPVYGSDAPQQDDEIGIPQYAEAQHAEAEYAEYAESYVEGADPFSDAAAEAQPRRRFRLVRVLSGLAAASILIAAGAVMLLRPELLGLKLDPEIIDRVQIDRPQTDLSLATPQVELPPEPVTPEPVTPEPVTPEPVTPEPVTPEPVTPEPVTPEPVTPEPVTPEPVTPEPVTPDPVIANPEPIEDFGPLRIGETGIIVGDETTTSRGSLTIGVSVGSQAFAQLHNGNYFVGVVKKVAAPENVTLSLSQGEVTLALAELKTLAPLGSKEYRALQEADQGYVRLVNNSLLRGTVLRHNRDDNVILQMKSNQVLIPQSDVEEVGSGQPTAVQLDDDGDMDWVRRLVEEGMDRESELPETEEAVPPVRVRIDR